MVDVWWGFCVSVSGNSSCRLEPARSSVARQVIEFAACVLFPPFGTTIALPTVMRELFLTLIFVSVSLSVGCADSTPPRSVASAGDVDGKADRFDKDRPELELLYEERLEDLLEHPDTSRFEASGVAVLGDRLVVVFDNLRRFVTFDADLGDAQWFGDPRGYGLDDDDRVEDPDDFAGFEGVAVDLDTGRLSLAVEAMETKDGDHLPVVVHWNSEGSEIEWLDYEVEDLNKGVEGLGYLEVEGRRWLAALCETGKCDDRDRGRLILRDEEGALSHVDLPKGLDFEDFSGLAIREDRLAVVSQETSRVWIGWALMDEDGELDLVTDEVYDLPRQRDGDVDFCTVEGLDWFDSETLVAVSDLEKGGQAKRCENHAERIHFFDVPR